MPSQQRAGGLYSKLSRVVCGYVCAWMHSGECAVAVLGVCVARGLGGV